ncbi:MAG: PEP-CTERM sorting domain-containing protein [Planctomycetia bacterium]|nr:PEP-CTERM sorting domain-containing protein [Planctomycetia bacterium]
MASTNNSFDIYLNVPSLTGSDRFYGGIFTDNTVDPYTGLSNATYNYFVKGDGGGPVSYKGAMYYTLAQYNATNSTSFTVTMGTERVPSASFTGLTVENGYVQMLAVPEPSSFVLLLVGVLALGGRCWTQRTRRR